MTQSLSPPVRRCLLGLSLALLVIAAYQGAWHSGFIWDDDAYVTRNPLLTAPDGLRRIWLSLDVPSQYFPLTYTVLRWERGLWGLDPTRYHAVSLALHIANGLLLWWLLARLKIPGAFLAALVFALHPVQVESVAWITELKNLLMGFFFLLTLVSWTFFVNEPSSRRWRFYVAAIVLYVLALSAKSTACTLPAALVLILWLEKKPITKGRWGQVVPFVILGLAMGLVAIWWERFHQGTRGVLFALSPLERLLVASRAIWFYLGKLFWPADLAFIYPRWSISTSDPRQYAWLAACLAAIPVVLFLRKWTGRSLEVAALFFAATLAPVLGFIMLYTFRYTYVADHYQYLACIGPIALVAAALAQLTKRRRFLGAGLALGVVTALALLTQRQSVTYRDVETLWRTTIARSPDCWMAYNNLGIELASRGAFDEAVQQYNKSIALESDYAQAHYNLGTVLLQKGEVDRALAECRISLNLQPNDPDAHVALGNALLAAGRRDESIAEYERALALEAGSADAHYNLGRALQEKGETSSAADHYRTALQIAPETMEAHLNLGNILLQEGDEEAAVRHYRSALAVSPHSGRALNNLAWVLATASDRSRRNGAEAVRLADEANSSFGGTDPVVLHTLAAAYAETGRFEKGLEMEEQALDLAMRQENAPLAEETRRTAQLYARRLPYQKP
jgi:tetratricopeptide (TPR) repeat protein